MKKILLIILISSAFSSLAYGNRIFDEIYSAIKNDATQLQIRELENKYADKTISGTGYVYDVMVTEEGETIVLVKEDPVLWPPNYVVIHINEDYLNVARELKKNQKIYFSGPFEGISQGSIIVGSSDSKINPR